MRAGFLTAGTWVWALALFAWIGSSSDAFACATCFGASDDALAKGMNMGIFTLLGVVVLMWGAVGGFFIFLMRRGKQLREESGEMGAAFDESSTGLSK